MAMMNKEQINASQEYQYLQFVDFKNLGFWDRAIKQSHNKERNEKGFVSFSQAISKSDVIEKMVLEKDKKYKILGVRVYGKGVFISREAGGNTLITKTTKHYYKAKKDHLFWCKVDTKNGAFGITKQEHENCFASNNMEFAKIDTSQADVEYLQLLFKDLKFQNYLDSFAVGTTNRRYIKFNELLNIQIPLPLIPKQQKLVATYNQKTLEAEAKEQKASQLEKSIDEYLIEELGIELPQEEVKRNHFLRFVEFKNLSEWGTDKVFGGDIFYSKKYELTSLDKKPSLFIELFRGKSPKYKNLSDKFILNQKCVRWNDLKLEFRKPVDQKWLESIDDKSLTKLDDILINSTGEGTIGRASKISKLEWEGLLYDSHILLLRFNKSQINASFFTEFFNGKFGQWQVNEIKSAQSTKQTELGLANLRKIKFPLPPLPIQNQIADKISSIKQEIKTLKNEAERLRAKAKEEFENEVFRND